jgi:hypothetical protein
MVGTWKVLNKTSPGSGTEFGADDTDKINKLLRGDLDVDTVQINSPFQIRDNKLLIRDPLNLTHYIVRTSGIIANRQVTLPLLQSDDIFTFNDHAATLTQKILAAARVSNYFDVESTSTPGNPSANILRVYRRSSDNALVYRNNAGTETVLGGGGGGGSGEINTASNIGTAGANVFKSKVGVDLQFRKINGLTSTGLITITEDTPNNKIDVKIEPSGINDRYMKTDSTGATVWAKPGKMMPDGSIYDGSRWGTLMGGAFDGDGLLSGITTSGNAGVDGSSSGNRTRLRTGATAGATAGWQTLQLITRAGQNVKFKARFASNFSTERIWFGMISTTSFPHGTTPLANQHGALFGFNETDSNWTIRTNNGSATSNGTSTGVLKDTNLHTFEIQLHSTPAVSAWVDGTQILNANITQPPGTTNNLMCACYAQAVGANDVGTSTDWAMIYFNPVQ